MTPEHMIEIIDRGGRATDDCYSRPDYDKVVDAARALAREYEQLRESATSVIEHAEKLREVL